MLEVKDYCWSSWKIEKIREQMDICPSLLIPMVVLERKRKKFHTGPTPGTFRRPWHSICLSHQAFQICKIMLHAHDGDSMHSLGSVRLSDGPEQWVASFFSHAKRTWGHPCWAKFHTALQMDRCNRWNSCQQITLTSQE